MVILVFSIDGFFLWTQHTGHLTKLGVATVTSKVPVGHSERCGVGRKGILGKVECD